MELKTWTFMNEQSLVMCYVILSINTTSHTAAFDWHELSLSSSSTWKRTHSTFGSKFGTILSSCILIRFLPWYTPDLLTLEEVLF